MVIHTKAFEYIKKLNFSPQILISFNSELPIEIWCDTSKDTIGCFILHEDLFLSLMQKDKPLHFYSRSMNDAEINVTNNLNKPFSYLEGTFLNYYVYLKKKHTLSIYVHLNNNKDC